VADEVLRDRKSETLCTRMMEKMLAEVGLGCVEKLLTRVDKIPVTARLPWTPPPTSRLALALPNP